MKRTDVVIGAAYGDEGKGNVSNALCTSNSINVRFNGGAQAGHTAIGDVGRIVFSHFGAGTMRGATTYLSKFFVCMPVVFLDEYDSLRSKGLSPSIAASPEALVTTPWDVFINIMLEEKRGVDRHGSVGLGFGETIERSERGLPLKVKDLAQWEYRGPLDVLHDIRDDWFPQRCEELGIDLTSHPTFGEETSMGSCVFDNFLGDCCRFRRTIGIVPDEYLRETEAPIVFEGAQGLMLDQSSPDFPHVSRSNCGIDNVLELVDDNTHLDVHYLTRAYTTRHGAGPLPHELPGKPYPVIVDETNVPNDHQGTLRFSYLNLDTVAGRIKVDMEKLEKSGRSFTPCGVITCMDQLPSEPVWLIVDDEMHPYSRNALPGAFRNITRVESVETVWTPKLEKLG